MNILNRANWMTSSALALVAMMAGGCDESPGIPGGASHGGSGNETGSVAEDRMDEARSRGNIGEGSDLSDWKSSDPELFDARIKSPSLVFVGDFGSAGAWTPPEGTFTAKPTPFRFEDGEICTFGSQEWGSLCVGDEASAACIRDRLWNDVVPGGVIVGGERRFHLSTTGAAATAMPASGIVGPLTSSQKDPLSLNANQLGAELVALELNLAFNDHGTLGTSDFGSALMVGGMFDGWRVNAVVEFAGRMVGGEAYLEDGVEFEGYNALLDELQALNAAGQGCQAANYIRR